MIRCLFVVVGLSLSAGAASAQEVWDGPLSFAFDRGVGADWTLAENQDQVTPSLQLTRQNAGPIYNRQWWLDTLARDAVTSFGGGELGSDFFYVADAVFPGQPGEGGVRGTRWTILNADDASSFVQTNLSGYGFFGTLGDLTNYGSFATVVAQATTGVNTNLSPAAYDAEALLGNLSIQASPNNVLGVEFGVYSEVDDLFFRLKFTEWGGGGSGTVGYVRSEAAVLLGDFDGDGDVDGNDFGVFAGQFSMSEPPELSADLNDDGVVNGNDFGIFAGNFGIGLDLGASVSEPGSGVPEPGVVGVRCLGVLAGWGRSRPSRFAA